MDSVHAFFVFYVIRKGQPVPVLLDLTDSCRAQGANDTHADTLSHTHRHTRLQRMGSPRSNTAYFTAN